ncbi:hypothetical protein AWI08_04130 [Klebsiella aerogenes]|nr:hypothetical protein AWI08_04130 [Klebsiella aerogenes]
MAFQLFILYILMRLRLSNDGRRFALAGKQQVRLMLFLYPGEVPNYLGNKPGELFVRPESRQALLLKHILICFVTHVVMSLLKEASILD